MDENMDWSMFYDWLNRGEPNEGLFISLYFFGFATPMMVVMILTFMVHVTWRNCHEGQRIRLLGFMSELVYDKPVWTLSTLIIVVFSMVWFLEAVAWHRASVMVSITGVWVSVWFNVWAAKYSISRIVDIINEDYDNRLNEELKIKQYSISSQDRVKI